MNELHVPHKQYIFQATCPRVVTKTDRDYFWCLNASATKCVEAIRNHTFTGYDDYLDLKESMRKFWVRQVLAKSGLPTMSKSNQIYSLRSVRAMRATEWVKEFMEFKVMGWTPAPPNPLTHTEWSTTLKYYAVKGSEDEWQARRRAFAKYADDPNKQADWFPQHREGLEQAKAVFETLKKEEQK